MSTFEFPESIKSRPTYDKLEKRAGKSYLFIADAEGAEAIIDLASTDQDLMTKSHVIYIPKDTGEKYQKKLNDLNIKLFVLTLVIVSIIASIGIIIEKHLVKLELQNTFNINHENKSN